MNTLALTTELTHLALNRRAFGNTPEEVLNHLQQFIKSSSMPLGTFIGRKCTSKRSIGKDIRTAKYVLFYDKHALMIKLTHFLPRNKWEISTCSFI